MVHPIVVYGDPILRQRGQDIEIGSDVSTLVADMFDTMYAAQGIGLAAPQLGKSLRLFVVDGSALQQDEENEPGMDTFKKVFINPVMVEEYGEPWLFEEGCLSIPNIREKISRKSKVRIRYYDENWVLHEDEFDGMKARIIQHEYDHIEGKLFIDYLSPLRKRVLKGKLADISRGNVETEYRIRVPVRK
jgi:peptide deformylase